MRILNLKGRDFFIFLWVIGVLMGGCATSYTPIPVASSIKATNLRSLQEKYTETLKNFAKNYGVYRIEKGGAKFVNVDYKPYLYIRHREEMKKRKYWHAPIPMFMKYIFHDHVDLTIKSLVKAFGTHGDFQGYVVEIPVRFDMYPDSPTPNRTTLFIMEASKCNEYAHRKIGIRKFLKSLKVYSREYLALLPISSFKTWDSKGLVPLVD